MAHTYTTRERALLHHLRDIGQTGEFTLDQAVMWLGYRVTNPDDHQQACMVLIRELTQKVQADGGAIEMTAQAGVTAYRYTLA